jgi:hypothetical protein
MAVPANIVVAWPSTVVSIPTGWTRVTALDARYVLGSAAGADTDLVTDRGFATHTHTSPSHNPVQNAHTHTINAPGGDALNVFTGTVASTGADDTHGHDAFASAAATATNNGIAITVNATSNDLAFVEVIWIASDGTPATLPSGCLAFFAADVFPANWTRAYADRYLKGAATGTDGGTTGGANTHTHTSPAHTHTQNAHTHGAVTSTPGNAALSGTGPAGTDPIATTGHTHSVSLTLQTATNQSVTTTINSSSHEPPFSKINVIQSSAATLPTSIICLWIGANSAIPASWSRYTALDAVWAKGSTNDGEVGTTGGGLIHNHTAVNCQPTQNAHTHLVNGGTSVGSKNATSGASGNFAAAGHTHSWSVTSDVATNQSTAVTINNIASGDALPKHRTAIYVQFAGSAPGPAVGCYTSYNYLWAFEQIEGGPPPEETAAIARGDRRYMRQETP